MILEAASLGLRLLQLDRAVQDSGDSLSEAEDMAGRLSRRS